MFGSNKVSRKRKKKEGKWFSHVWFYYEKYKKKKGKKKKLIYFEII